MNPTPIRSVTSGRFWDLFDALPRDLQDLARAAYDLFHENPSHPGLQFKLVLPRRKIYSARVGIHCRVLGVLEDDTVIWFWIGPHDEYDKLLKRLR
jgi:hypothetical protein